MKKFNNKSGFTLIEIIVVLIIIGILAAIALPNLFSHVQESRGSTAIAAMDGIKTGLEAYAAQNVTAPNSTELATLGLGTTTASETNGFYFTIPTSTGSPSSSPFTYDIQASDGTNQITLSRDSNGTFTCTAGTSGPYANAC